jgi:hypothetical protein
MIRLARKSRRIQHAMTSRRTQLRAAVHKSETPTPKPSQARVVAQTTLAPKAERRNARAAYARLVGPWRLRVESDAEGFPRTSCRYGWIEYYDERRVAVYTEHPRIATRLLRIPGVRKQQTGDVERRMLVVSRVAFAEVIMLLRARRQRVISPKSLRNLRPFRARRRGLRVI